MDRMIAAFRNRFHPIHQLRKSRVGRAVVDRLDIPIWTRIYLIRWPVRVQAVRHASYTLVKRTPEPEITALFLAVQRLCAPQVFWDVGANFGYYSWLLLSRSPEMQCRLFEPEPVNLRIIGETIQRNHLTNVSVWPVAVSDASGHAAFARDVVSGATGTLEDPGQSFASRHYKADIPRMTVRTVTLDEVCAGSRPPDLIKIDVEGHEEQVLRGGSATIRKHQPLITVECYHRPSPAVSLLREAGYTLLDAERPTADLANTTNYLAVPPRFAAQIGDLVALWQQVRAKI